MSEHLSVDHRPGIAVLTLQRPDRANALTAEMVQTLGALTREAVDNQAVRAIVLTGSGRKAFCSGADLKERRSMSDDDVRRLLTLYRTELGVLDGSPKPVIAAVNGLALGGGLELALLCDLRFAAEHAQLGFPETGLGIIPGAGGTQRLPRVVGEGRAKEMILLGRRVDALTALAWGLVSQVFPDDESFLDSVCAAIEPIARGAPRAQRAALRAIDVSYAVELEHGLELEQLYYDDCLRSEDRKEALQAFAEKRPPVFCDR